MTTEGIHAPLSSFRMEIGPAGGCEVDEKKWKNDRHPPTCSNYDYFILLLLRNDGDGDGGDGDG